MPADPLRIAIVTESYPPNISGVAVFASRLASDLLAAGHQVVVCAPSPTGKPFVETIGGVTVHRLRSIPNPLRKKFRLVVGQQRAAAGVLAAFRPDIIHVQDPGGSSSAAFRFARKAGVPVVGTYHFSAELVAAYLPFGKAMVENWKPLIQAYCKDFYSGCSAITCPSETVKRELDTQEIGPPIYAISNGIDTNSPLVSIERDGALRKVPTFLSVGRLDEDKNIMTLLRAVPYVLEKRKIKLVIVGDGNKRRACSQWVIRHGLEDTVLLKGALVPGSQRLNGEYEKADAFVTPSLIETQGIVVLEAMLAGLPVVAANANALPELVKDGETGILVSPVTPKALAASMLQMLENPERARAWGLEGRKRVILDHSREHTLERFVALYRQVRAA